MSQDRKPLDQKVADWLESQGYPLEMYVAQTFQKSNFDIGMSAFYNDFETKQVREIDVTAHRFSKQRTPVFVQFSCYIECKLARDKPWLLFQHSLEPDRFAHFSVVSSTAMQQFLQDILQEPQYQSRIKNLPLFQYSNLAYGVTQAFTTGQDVPYQAVMSSVKAAVARALDLDDLLLHHDPPLETCGITIPIVVIDGALFECQFSNTEQLIIQEVDKSILHWKSPNPTKAIPFVHIVTKPALEQFVKEVEETANGLMDIVQEHIVDLVEIIKKMQTTKIGIHI